MAKDTNVSTAGGATAFKSEYDPLLRTGLVVGDSFGPVGYVTPRIELEGGYNSVTVKNHAVTQNGVTVASGGTDSFGDLRSTTGLLNGLLDLELGRLSGAHDLACLGRRQLQALGQCRA
jgi:hypothetical protein